jgi:hypothetical protein
VGLAPTRMRPSTARLETEIASDSRGTRLPLDPTTAARARLGQSARWRHVPAGSGPVRSVRDGDRRPAQNRAAVRIVVSQVHELAQPAQSPFGGCCGSSDGPRPLSPEVGQSCHSSG